MNVESYSKDELVASCAMLFEMINCENEVSQVCKQEQMSEFAHFNADSRDQIISDKSEGSEKDPKTILIDKKEESDYDFEVVVLGGGIGGYFAAIRSAQAGKKTAIIEEQHIGGTCLNKGCIPTKAFLRSIAALKEVNGASEFGIDGLEVASPSLNLEKVQARKKLLVSQLVAGVEALLAINNVTVFKETGEIIAQHEIKVGDKKITTDFIIIATGSKAKILQIPIDENMSVFTSTEILNIENIPNSMVIIGGGVIGVEFAYFLANAGCKVTIIEFMDRILPMVDEEITEQVSKMLQSLGVEIHTGAEVTEITASTIIFKKDEVLLEKETDTVLMSVGRSPRIKGIPCEELGIAIDRGAIVTDNTLKTSVNNIYAIGDVNGKVMLAHTASMEGVVAVKNICGESVFMDYDKIPSAIYLSPEIASVGLTEEQARNKFGDVNIGRFPLFANGKSLLEGEGKGLIKVISEPKNKKIVGAHLYCSHATEMIAEVVTAMTLEGTVDKMQQVIHPHPTVSEALMEAIWAIYGKAIHSM